MIQQYLNWRNALFLAAIGIVIGTIIYSHYLAQKIAAEERHKVSIWIDAGKALISAPVDTDMQLISDILTHEHDIPVIRTDAKGNVIDYINIDSAKVLGNPDFLNQKIKQFKDLHNPIVYNDPINDETDYYYFGNSKLLQEVKYYPIVQLLIVALFIIITVYAINIKNKSEQNQLWAGMAKETAHQLGTPVTSLQGWVAMLKEDPANEKIAIELAKDVDRLQLVSDRFGKIGSTPKLKEEDLMLQINGMVDYMKKRAAGKIQFEIIPTNETTLPVQLSAALFDWVIENLLKNALDAMEGEGKITLTILREQNNIIIDVSDTGKGMQAANIKKVFSPGFTTKKRGWGLGLTLSKRIIDEYHHGSLFVKESAIGKGTTFRIILPSGGTKEFA